MSVSEIGMVGHRNLPGVRPCFPLERFVLTRADIPSKMQGMEFGCYVLLPSDFPSGLCPLCLGGAELSLACCLNNTKA